VALLDLDLRNPSLHRFFNLSSGPGLSDVALGRIPLSTAITQVISFAVDGDGRQALLPEGRLEVLAAGTPQSSPGEFVAHLPIQPILDELKGHSNIILIDAPPLLQVSDAIALSSAVDAIVVVSRVNVVSAAMLDDLNRILRTSPAPRLGLVLTAAELEAAYGYFLYPRHQRRQAVG
jgi:Mrp family chromosome partitioning ATPase